MSARRSTRALLRAYNTNRALVRAYNSTIIMESSYVTGPYIGPTTQTGGGQASGPIEPYLHTADTVPAGNVRALIRALFVTCRIDSLHVGHGNLCLKQSSYLHEIMC